MNARNFRSMVIVGAVSAGLMTGTRTDAARNSGVLERFVARAVDVEDPTQVTKPVDILISRWSTAAEADALRATLPHGAETLLPALHGTLQLAGFAIVLMTLAVRSFRKAFTG